MSEKSNLPLELYVNHEYLPLIKQNCDRLRPILHLAKNSPKYKDKCRLENDTLILDGNRYTIDDIMALPEEVATYKSAQKVDDSRLAFHLVLLVTSIKSLHMESLQLPLCRTIHPIPESSDGR